MLFKNAVIFRMKEDFPVDSDNLEGLLKGRAKEPIGPNEMSRIGWSSPFGYESEILCGVVDGVMFMTLSCEEKVLPAAVINEEVDKRKSAIESEQQRPLRRKEKNELKEEIIIELMPKAFSKTTTINGYVDPENKLLVIDASSSKKAEEFASHLRETLGSLPVQPIVVSQSPTFTMTGWVSGEVPIGEGISLGEEADLVDSLDNQGKMKLKGLDLRDDDIIKHIKNGFIVNRIAVMVEGRIGFNLSDDLIMKGIKYDDEVFDADEENDDVASRIASNMFVSKSEINGAIDTIAQAFGGEAE